MPTDGRSVLPEASTEVFPGEVTSELGLEQWVCGVGESDGRMSKAQVYWKWGRSSRRLAAPVWGILGLLCVQVLAESCPAGQGACSPGVHPREKALPTFLPPGLRAQELRNPHPIRSCPMCVGVAEKVEHKFGNSSLWNLRWFSSWWLAWALTTAAGNHRDG